MGMARRYGSGRVSPRAPESLLCRCLSGSLSHGAGRKLAVEPVLNRTSLAGHEEREHGVGGAGSLEKRRITREDDAGSRASQGHEGVTMGKEGRILVKMDAGGARVRGSLTGGDGDGLVSTLVHGVHGVLGVGQHPGVSRELP